MAEHVEECEYFTSSLGHKLYKKCWNENFSDDFVHKALVFLSHGYAEHCLWYTDIAKLLVAEDFYVFSHDHVGHGQSSGDRVHVESYEEYVKDVVEHIASVKSKFSNDMKVFIVGHSMGGQIATLAAISQPKEFNGIVLIGPAFSLPKNPNVLEVGFLKATSWLVPQLPLASLSLTTLTRNKEKVQEYQDDPLIWHGKSKAGWIRQYKAAMDHIHSVADTVEWPFLLMHGSADAIVPITGSKDFYAKTKSTDKTFQEYDGYCHQLHNEPEPDGGQIRQTIVDWIKQRTV